MMWRHEMKGGCLGLVGVIEMVRIRVLKHYWIWKVASEDLAAISYYSLHKSVMTSLNRN